MQEIQVHTGVSSENWQHPDGRKEHSLNHPRSGRRKKKGSSPIRLPRCNFLNTVFAPIPAHTKDCCLILSADERKNIKKNDAGYIIRSANNILKQISSSTLLEDTGNLEKNCLAVHQTLTNELPDDIKFKIDFHKKQFSIILYKAAPIAKEFTLFFLPIAKVSTMDSTMGTLFKQFISFLSKSQGFDFPDTHSDFAYALEYSNEDEEYEEDEENIMIATIKQYNNGEPKKVFDEIKRMSVNPLTLRADILEHRKTADAGQQDLIDLLVEGIDILRTGDLRKYNPSPYTDYYNDFLRTCAITWEIDCISDYVTELINSDLQEEIINPYPYYHKAITPKSKTLFTENSFTINLTTWLLKLTEELENEQNN